MLAEPEEPTTGEIYLGAAKHDAIVTNATSSPSPAVVCDRATTIRTEFDNSSLAAPSHYPHKS